jgi:DNA replication and repair protein RecF
VLNGKPAKFSAIREKIPIVVFSPDDHALIRHSPEARRSFMDEIFSDVIPGYVEVLERFERTLKNRNKLIKQHQALELKAPNAELKTFTELLVRSSYELFTIRMEIWATFSKRFSEVSSELFKVSTPDISVSYDADIFHFKKSASSLEDFRIQMENSWSVDIATGWTHRGPHRDDIHIAIEGLDSRTKASQGQARLLALALKWTHALWVTEERRERPLFLIDDLSSELDATHRGRLLDLIKELSCQVFISGTDPSLVDFQSISDYTHYRVEKGEISPL